MFDSEALKKVLHDDGCGHVVAVVAGHQHRGGYALVCCLYRYCVHCYCMHCYVCIANCVHC